MEKITYSSEYFHIENTLKCGQTFRFYPFKDGYFVISKDKAAYLKNSGASVEIYTDFANYFKNYFDTFEDYGKIVSKVKSFGIDYLSKAVQFGKGIRILRQDYEETVYSFIISQNNNIARIKKSIDALSTAFGEKREFMGEKYFAFPTTKVLKDLLEQEFIDLKLGYRAKFLAHTSKQIHNGALDGLENLSTQSIRQKLVSLMGIGQKVADCILLFAYRKTDSFPVDIWIEKIYKENFGGKLTDREKISLYFSELFGEYSGFVQQYLFHYKRVETNN